MAAPVSSISAAFANDASTIPIPTPTGMSGVKGAVFGRPGGPQTGLPTPPNSISPNLPAHSMKARSRYDAGAAAAAASPPSQIDSDIELGDAYEGHPKSLGNDQGHITPAMIARDYLPDIILGKGQVAVKDVINTLGRNLPGFIDIPPAKARRIVVGALEMRSGGPDGSVEFEKTGWGRWIGRLKPAGRRESGAMHTIVEGKATSPIDITSKASRVPNSRVRRPSRRSSHGSWTHESSSSEHYDRMDTDVFHNDMDEMLIDGDADAANRYTASRIRHEQDPEFFSDTDEEDWASIGADALRANSFTGRAGPWRYRRGSRRPSTRSESSRSMSSHGFRQPPRPLDFTGVEADDQEKAAIEALMTMGSA